MSHPQQQPIIHQPLHPPPPIPPHSDDVEEELRRIYIATATVFNPTLPTPPPETTPLDLILYRREPADRYLISFQRSPMAWLVCDRVLIESSDQTPAAAQRRFFAAQTLTFKCREELFIKQVPDGALPSLRDSLVTQMTHYFLLRGNRPLVTRLCMAISALAVQMRWTSIIPDVLETVYGPRQELAPVVLELFSILPEECCSERLFVGHSGKKAEMRDSFRKYSENVLGFLAHVFATTVGKMEVMSCMTSWLRHVDVPVELIENTTLLGTPFGVVKENIGDDVFEGAVDCIVEALHTYGTGPTKNQGLIQRIVPMVMDLGAGPFQKARIVGDQDVLRGYCRIFTEMGESYMELIMSKEDLQQNKLVELVLHCAELPDNEIACITMNFWYSYISALEDVQPYSFRQQRIDYYTPLLTRLLQVCTVLVRFPEDVMTLPIDTLDDILQNRYYVTETIQDLCRLLGGDTVINCLAERFQQEYALFTSNPDQKDVEENWQGLESCLIAISSIAQYIPNDESKYLPTIMNLISHRTLPQLSTYLRNTCSAFVGAYASWLGAHPNYLQPLMTYLAEAMSIQECASAAAVSVKQLCEDCYKQPMGEPVLNLYDNMIHDNDEAFKTDQKDENEVLEGVCKAVSTQSESNPRMANTCLERLAQPIGNRLTKIIAPENTSMNSRAVINEIERLTVIVRFLNLPPDPNQPGDLLILELMKQSWNLLDAVSYKYATDMHLAEKLSRLHKHALRKIGAELYKPLLDPLIAQLVRNFELSYQSPYLYLASICITEYGRNKDYEQKLFLMISQLSTACFSHLQTLHDFTTHPDVVEEFFYLVGRFMYYCPELLVLSPLLVSLLQCASVGMHVQHRDANKGTLNFLEHTLSYGMDLISNRTYSRSRSTSQYDDDDEEEAMPPEDDAKETAKRLLCLQSLQTAILAEGQNIVTNICRALVGELPAYSLDRGSGSITGVIWKFSVLCPELLLNWITVYLETAAVDGPQKKAFLDCLRERRGREELTVAVRKFNEFSERVKKLGKVNPGA